MYASGREIQFRESAYPNASGQARSQAACHEIGHAVGFWDYAFGHVGCMGGGTANNGVLAHQEIVAIDYCYAFGAC